MSNLADNRANLREVATRLNLTGNNRSLRWLELLAEKDAAGNPIAQTTSTLTRLYVDRYSPRLRFERTLGDAHSWLYTFRSNNVVTVREAEPFSDESRWAITELGLALWEAYRPRPDAIEVFPEPTNRPEYIRARVRDTVACGQLLVLASEAAKVDDDLTTLRREAATQGVQNISIALYARVEHRTIDPAAASAHAGYMISAHVATTGGATLQASPRTTSPMLRHPRPRRRSSPVTQWHHHQPVVETVVHRR